MRSIGAFVLLLGALSASVSAQAQGDTKLSSVQVQLWPEYDQPSMLVIYDFSLPDSASLPLSISLRFPKAANLVAVAAQGSDGSLLNTDYQGPTAQADWQVITIQIQSTGVYHVEYYEPLSRDGNVRHYSYLWPGDYAVDDFVVSVRLPADATNISSVPLMESSQSSDGTPYLRKDFGSLGANQELRVELDYTKTSEALTASAQSLQPSQPLGASTPGRVVLGNYLPYVLVVLGFALILGGGLYFWQSSRAGRRPRSRRHVPSSDRQQDQDSDVYCHECGTRAHTGDRFCRICGTRLRAAG
jgi:hypothetical protein